MKTPRLALLAIALPALLLASAASAGPAPAAPAADLPKWNTVDEGFRAWPSVYFTVGKDNRELRCRWSECNPEKNKGVSNLYLLIEKGPRVQIQSEYIELQPLGKYDPRRLWGTEYTQVTRKVTAHRQNYTSQLSHFKLDNTGDKLMVVQGTNKYPATTDINTTYVSETGGKIAVVAPTKKADDALKPDGSVNPAPPTRRPVQYRWCNPATGKTRVSHNSPGAGWTKLESDNSVCKKADGTRSIPPPDAAPAVALSAKEKLWLTKGQRAEYEEALKVAEATAGGPEKASAMKDLVDRTRKIVAFNLQPNAAAASAYEAAAGAKDATPAKIDGALPAEVWGGANSEIVGLEGTRADIQLSKEEYAVLGSSVNAAALKAYKDSRKGADGNPSGSTLEGAKYDPAYYDPIALHLGTMAARAVAGKTPGPVVTPPGGGEDPKVPPLTADEMKLLTPAERLAYEKLLQNVKDKVPGAVNALALESDRLRRLIAQQNRAKDPAYKAPRNAEEFAKLPNWHKDIFCDPKKLGSAAAAADTSAAGLDNSRNARAGLENSAAAGSGQTGGTATSAPAGGLPDWAKGPCAIYLAGKPPEPGNGGTGGSGGGRINQGLGPDAVAKEVEDTPANSWFMRSQIQTFAKGALIGLVLGSLFGPIGLIAGPLIGGALFYGMEKYDAVKADKKEKNPPE